MSTPRAIEIADEGFRSRFEGLPRIIASWVEGVIDLSAANVLDFGCGEGVTALGMILKNRVRTLWAVDIMPDVDNCRARAREHLGLESLPDNLHLQRIEPGADFAHGEQFDLIYSWSVFEHVEQSLLAGVLAQLRSKLRPGGHLFIQIAPLYYSADGSHLFHRIPEPWGHLSNQHSAYYAKLCNACDSKDEVAALWSCYEWLNRITAPQLKRALTHAGFDVIREYYTVSEHTPPPQLLEIFAEDVLRTTQVVYLCRAAE